MKYLTLLLLIFNVVFAAESLIGTVVGVSDGDTLTLLTSDKKQVKIRLAEIDAPESKQAFGQKSKQTLSELCFKKAAIVDVQSVDKYKRTVGRIMCDGVDANAEMVNVGLAWVYDQYVKDKTLYDLQNKAKSNKIGLWSDKDPVAPWQYRKDEKTNKPVKPATAQDKPVIKSGFSCDIRKTCKQMISCAEAKFYLNQCGVQRLDRDNDGVPCESICR